MAEVTGIDHIYVTVSDLVQSERFYDRVLGVVLEFRKNEFVIGGDRHIQYFNRHFGFVLRPARVNVDHEAYAAGLHHFCFRVESKAEVEVVAKELRKLGIEATPAKLYPHYAPDYTATFFEDPDGIRLEVTNYRRERRDRHDSWAEQIG
jgi:glyoxylase I family protein